MLIETNDPRTVSVMGLLQHLNTQELRDLLNEDSRLEFIIKDSQMVKQQESEKDVILASNKSLAEYNLSWEPKVTIGKQKLVELYQTACQLEKIVEEKEKKMGNQNEGINTDTAMALLQSAASQAEDESEAVADKFLDRTLDVDTFVEEFQARRKTAHLRRVKTDKMKELMAKQKTTSSSNLMRPAPPPPPVFASQAPQPMSFTPNNPLPYPTTASNLPYPIFPPNQPSGMPYPMPSTNMYPRF